MLNFFTFFKKSKNKSKKTYDYARDQDNLKWFTPELIERSETIEKQPFFSYPAYEKLWHSIFASEKDLIIGQKEYGKTHKKRFFEVMNILAMAEKEQPAANILEFGISEFSGMYKKAFPSINFYTSDRPVPDDFIGFTEEKIRFISKCEDHFSIDLEDLNQMESFVNTQKNKFNLILFAEVLEHLTIHPVDLMSNMIQLLNNQGYLYITTPNFFSKKNRLLMKKWENPQEVYPSQNGNWDAHHHYREYAQKELFRFIENAGGKVLAFYFSDCWDSESIEICAEKSNMVFLIKKAMNE